MAIEKGIGPKKRISITNNFRIDKVVDVRTKIDLVIGSIIGSNFEPGEMAVINDVPTFPATFGNKNCLTFAIRRKPIAQSRELNVELFCPSIMERSASYKLNIEN